MNIYKTKLRVPFLIIVYNFSILFKMILVKKEVDTYICYTKIINIHGAFYSFCA